MSWGKKFIIMIGLPIIASLLFPSCFALQRKAVSDDSEIEIVVSQSELNRIKTTSDYIEAIKGNPGETESLLEDGEIYIAINTDAPTSIFIKTKAGYTYKMMLVPRNIPAEQIFLKNQDIIAKSEIKKEGGRDHMRDLIKAMQSDLEYTGYVREPVSVVNTIDNTNSKLLTRYVGNYYIGEKYRCYANKYRCEQYMSHLSAVAKSIREENNGVYMLYIVRTK